MCISPDSVLQLSFIQHWDIFNPEHNAKILKSDTQEQSKHLPYHPGIVEMFYSLRFIAGLPQSLPQTTTPASKSLRATRIAVF